MCTPQTVIMATDKFFIDSAWVDAACADIERLQEEVERLQAERDKASALISKLAELLVPFSSLMNKHEQEMLIKAVRGE